MAFFDPCSDVQLFPDLPVNCKRIGILTFFVFYKNYQIRGNKIHLQIIPPDSTFFDSKLMPAVTKLHYFSAKVFSMYC